MSERSIGPKASRALGLALRVGLVCALAAGAAGCGQKGPLYLPDDVAKSKKKQAEIVRPLAEAPRHA